LKNYRSYLQDKSLLKNESFKYEAVKISETSVSYNGILASKIVFCEGYGLHKNPFFNYLPMQEAKGELLIIRAPNLNIDFLLKAAVFVMPLGNNLYKIGATFNWNDKTAVPTEKGKQELISKLESFITVPYEIIEQRAGIRPTVKDRRPLVGKHPNYSNMAILNGLGTRGVMIAPEAAKALYNHLEHQTALDKEIAITRF
jgi:glycine/D-amino acid oxidase-like deaminating enzyme